MKLESVLKAYDGGNPLDDWYSKFNLVASDMPFDEESDIDDAEEDDESSKPDVGV